MRTAILALLFVAIFYTVPMAALYIAVQNGWYVA